MYESGGRSSSDAAQAFEKGDFAESSKDWKNAAGFFQRSEKQALAVQGYRKAKADYESAVAAIGNRGLLDQYAAADWKEAQKQAKLGEASAEDPEDGSKAYGVALASLNKAVADVEKKSVPTLTIEAVAEGKVVAATVEAGGQTWTTPATLKLEKNQGYEFQVSYAGGGTQWKVVNLSRTANWVGPKTERVVLEETKGPVEGQDWTSPSTGMEFVWIPALKIWVGKYEVTNGEYRKYKPGHDSKEYSGHSLNGDRQPVVQVNFDDAKEYAAWMTQQDAGVVNGGRYRLPSEDEWMAFAQCGDGREYPWGNNWPPRSGQAGNYHGQEGAGSWDKISGYNDGSPVTCNVGDSWKNPWGLFGVGGNVWEACAGDRSVASFGAWRGASWGSYFQVDLRCSCRYRFDGSYRDSDSGFRLVLSRSTPETGSAMSPPVNAASTPRGIPSVDDEPNTRQVRTVDLGGGVTMDLVWVPAGEFDMGSSDGDDDEKPVHRVKISKGFWMGKTEVTQEQWERVMGSNSSYFKGANLPVEKVNWSDAKEFVRRLSLKPETGNLKYRLPTEAEWEYACRAGTTGAYAGNLNRMGWHSQNSENKTHEVGQKSPNGWGLYDMHGNVWEWCEDWFGDYPSGSPTDTSRAAPAQPSRYEAYQSGSMTDPIGPSSGSDRVLRGGSWGDSPELCRSAYRDRRDPGFPVSNRGFRVVAR